MENIGILLAPIFGGVIGLLIGKNRKIGAGWAFVIGFFLGFIGWIIAACSKKNEVEFTEMTKEEDK